MAGTDIPANTTLWVQLEKALDSSKLKVGDHFSGELAEAVIMGGKDVIPKGAKLKGHVTNKPNPEALSLELDSLAFRGGDYQIKANPVSLQAAAGHAFEPKQGILQFFLAEPLHLKS